MTRNVSSLFAEDSDLRWSIIYRSIIFVFLCSLTMLMLGIPLAIVQVVVIFVGLVGYFGQVYAYHRGKRVQRPAVFGHTLRFPLIPLAAFAGIAACFILLSIYSPRVQAAVLDWRLKAISQSLSEGSSKSKSSLPALSSAIATARKERIPIKGDLAIELQEKLASMNSDSPGYWASAAELISYQSNPIGVLPGCAETEPEHLYWAPLDHLQHKQDPPPDQVRFKSCQLDLNMPLPLYIVSPTQTDAASIVCEQCSVYYSGGLIPAFSQKKYIHFIFTDCEFALSASDDLPQRGKDLINAVLGAKNRQNVSFGDDWDSRSVNKNL